MIFQYLISHEGRSKSLGAQEVGRGEIDDCFLHLSYEPVPCQGPSWHHLTRGPYSQAGKVRFSTFFMTRQPWRDHFNSSNEEGKEEEMGTSRMCGVINKCFLILAAHSSFTVLGVWGTPRPINSHSAAFSPSTSVFESSQGDSSVSSC